MNSVNQTKLWKIVGLGILTALLGFALPGCESSHGQQAGTQALLKVPVAQPLYQDITEWDEYSGRFRAVERVEIRARVSGYVDDVKFEDGEIVKAGQVLFVIDPRPFQIALNQANAQLEQAKAGKRQAESAFDRVKNLKDSKAISQEEYVQREQALYGEDARVEAALANVANAQLQLQFTQVKAPITGKISEKFVTEGNLISGGSDQGTLLTTIVSLDPIYFYFEGSESALLKYARNQEENETKTRVGVRLLDEGSYPHEGELTFMDNEVDFGTGTFQGRATIPNPDYVITPGMFGTARVFNTSAHRAIMIPDAVIATDQSQKIVYVLSEENKVEARAVELGPLYSSELRIIRTGLEPNDQVIIGNIQRIRPAMQVDPEVKTLASK